MTPDEINPTQHGVGVDVLVERLNNLDENRRADNAALRDTQRSENAALHHHFTSLETEVKQYLQRIGSVEVALHDHTLQQHHAGTESKLLEMSNQHLQFERKFSEVDRSIDTLGRTIEAKFATIETARVVEKAAVDARSKQRSQGLTALDKAIGLALLMIPIAITLVRG